MNQHERFFLQDLVLCACISHICNLFCNIIVHKIKQLVETFRGYPPFYTLSLLKGIQKGEYTPNTWLINFLHWSHFVCFFIHFFSFITDNFNYGSLLRKHLKMKIFLLSTKGFYFLHKCCSDNFALATICRCTLMKIQISLGKSLINCRRLRRILKAAAMQQLPSV